MRVWVALLLLNVLVLAGCLNGPIYWTKPGATPDSFLADHQPCFKEATIGYGVGSEQAYKACMRSKGYTRVQGRGTGTPDVPFFRGPEADDEFTATSQETLMAELEFKRQTQRELCAPSESDRPRGTVCP